MFYFCLLMAVKIIVIESRVFCQDGHATPWIAAGPSCPLRCENIRAGINRLKMEDYHNLLNQKFNNKRLSLYDKSANRTLDSAETKENNKLIMLNLKNPNFLDLEEGLLRKKVYKDIEKELKYQTLENGKCSNLLKMSGEKKSILMKLLRKCATRSSYEHDFVRIITRILNKYAHADYKFTEEMTWLLLNKILGPDIKLRHGLYDVPTLLGYLRSAITRHRANRGALSVLRLASTHCLTIHVPGCYCTNGFVESSGQCVHPADCISDSLQLKYLNRIILY